MADVRAASGPSSSSPLALAALAAVVALGAPLAPGRAAAALAAGALFAPRPAAAAPVASASAFDAAAPAEAASAAAVPALAPAPDAPEIREPFFAIVIAIAEGDSLGVWTGPELRARVRASGRRSRLPVERIVRLERWEAAPAEDETRDGARRARTWRLELDRPLVTPMPYDILGYHPGSLRLSREIVLGEWRLGDLNLHLPGNGKEPGRDFTVAGLFVLRLEQGWLVLDADGLVDRLLGAALDDTWTEGIALARVDGERAAVALGQNRGGRPLSGEFDLRQDKVLPHGRPRARALSGYGRPFCAVPDQAARAWRDPAWLAARD